MTAYVDYIDQLKAQKPNISWNEIAKLLGEMNGEQVRSKYRRAKKNPDHSPHTPTSEPHAYEQEMVEFLDKKHKLSTPWQDLLNLAVTGQVINDQLDDTQRTADIHIHTQKPIAVVFTGDWHLGDTATDHVRWAADIRTILEHERVFMIDVGDDRQNARNFRSLSVVLSQVLSPKQQAQLLRSIVDELTDKHKLLAKVDGNHDVEWDQRLFGEALQGYLLEKMDAPRFPNKGLLKLTVGQETYTILLFHKSRFSSFMRNTHGAYREYQLGFPADVVAGGHDHVPGFELINSYQMAREAGLPFGGMTYLIKCGTYQDSEYGWKYFHNGGRPVNITVIFWPDQHRMQVFFNTEDALQFLDTF